MMETADIYTEDRQRTGRTVARGQRVQPGEYRLVVHACIFSSEGKMLIQQRQPWKDWPNLWDLSVGGHAVAGETSRQAMARELREELGLQWNPEGMRPHLTINFPDGFDDYYLLSRDVASDEIVLQAEEVQQVRWATQEEICAMIDGGTFIPYYKSVISTLFEMRGRYGSRSSERGRR